LRRSVLVLVGVAVSASMLWLALWNTDFGSISQSLAAAHFVWSIPFLVALFLFYWLKAARWRDLLTTSVSARASDLFPSIMIGYAGTAILPLQMGELVRAYIVGKKYSLPFPLVLSSIGLERIFDLLTILVLLGLTLATGQSSPDILIKAGYIIGIIVSMGIIFAFWLVTKADSALAVARYLTSWMPSQFSDAILRLLDSVSRGFQSIRQPRLVIRIAANSIIQWSLMGVCIAISLAALQIDVPISGVVLVLVATIVGISLPTGPGYVGNIQFAFVIALQHFGIDPAQAIAASVFYHVLAYVAVVVVGFSFLHTSGYGMLELRNEARASTGVQD